MKNLVRYLLEEKKLYLKVDIKFFFWLKNFILLFLKKELLFFVNGFVVVLGCLEFVVECDFVVEVVEFVVFVVDFKILVIYYIFGIY